MALARAVVNRPALVLADEPTGNLASENSGIVLKMFRELNDRFNQTIIMITLLWASAAAAEADARGIPAVLVTTGGRTQLAGGLA